MWGRKLSRRGCKVRSPHPFPEGRIRVNFAGLYWTKLFFLLKNYNTALLAMEQKKKSINLICKIRKIHRFIRKEKNETRKLMTE